MGRLPVVIGLLALAGVGATTVQAAPTPQLSQRQTILEANRYLLADGWIPAPMQIPSEAERRWASVPLSSLSGCSGTGIGYCRFDYQRNRQRLSVVTVPSQPGRASVGRVERWW